MKFKIRSLILGGALALVAATTLLAATGKTPFVGWKGNQYILGQDSSFLFGAYGAKAITQPPQTSTTRGAMQALGYLQADSGNTVTAASNAASLSKVSGTITSEALTTAAGASYTCTLTNALVGVNSIVLYEIDNGTNTTAGLAKGIMTPADKTATFVVWNRHASVALNGTIKIRYVLIQ